MGHNDLQAQSSISVHRFADADALGMACATHIAHRMHDSDGPFLLGCPGGRSATPVYEALARFGAEHQPDWSNVVIVMMDDYVVGDSVSGFRYVDGEAHYSCRRFGRVDIVDRLNAGLRPEKRIRPDRLWFPDPDDPAAYDEQIRDAGGVDVFIIATGASDGHVAFNPPGSPIDGSTRIVQLADATRNDNLRTFPEFSSLADVPQFGVSVGLGTIRELSHEVVCVAHGEEKRHSVARILAASEPEPDWPATILSACDHASLWVTEDALPDN